MVRWRTIGRLLGAALAGLLLAASLGLRQAPAAAPAVFSAPGVDDAMDFHGDPCGADLVIFSGGNQWMVMPQLVAAFRRRYPAVKRVFYETLPPGVLAAQMHAGALQVGELSISAAPDVYMSGKRRMNVEAAAHVVAPPVAYASNVLALMVRAGNPKHVLSMRDLGRADVVVSMPNPRTEGVARQIELAMRKAGGAALVRAVMVKKVAGGTTLLTTIHHRQTPMWILSGKADAGPVWLSEALYQQRIKSGLAVVRIPRAQNVVASYEAAVVKAAPHAAAAKAFVAFLTSATAQNIYRSFGFAPPVVTSEE
jgi:molybdate transport system substrate-binding protein